MTEPIHILTETRNYYSNLYKKDDTITNIDEKLNAFIGDQLPKLSDEDKESCDAQITVSELSLALKSLNHNSSPGCEVYLPNCTRYSGIN